MKFQKLAHFFSQLEKTTSRNEMTEILARLFKETDSSEIDKICYLSLGRLAPLYEAIEFNLAEKMLIRILAKAYAQEEAEIKKKYKEVGDLGDTVAFFDKRKAAKPLSVEQAYERLREIATEAGTGSIKRKIDKMTGLLDDLDAQGAKYVVRIPLGKLRLGFLEMTILDALSWMLVGDKSKKGEIEAAYHVRADVGQIAKLIKRKGLKGLKGISVLVGTPVMPALCQRLPNAEEMIKKMCQLEAGQVAVEPKWDGTRLQIHFSRKRKREKKEAMLFDFKPPGMVMAFTRNLENVTGMFPDLARAVFKEVEAEEAVLDCEGVGFDPKTGRMRPFQETIKRKRKHGVSRAAKEIPLRFYCFDVLYKDGEDLLRTPFSKRREILKGMIKSGSKTIFLAPQEIVETAAGIRKYHQKQIKEGLEGAVVKKWQAAYDPGRRGYTWVKLKQEKGKKGGGLADTLDCLVMGYYRGKGRRAKFGIGAFLVGVRKGNQFVTVSKIGTGLSDEQWQEMHQRCEKVKTSQKPKEYQVDKNLNPDIWCEQKIVVEIEADNITKSPIHTAEYALRFPRLVKFRDDKSPKEVTAIDEVKRLYNIQFRSR